MQYGIGTQLMIFPSEGKKKTFENRKLKEQKFTQKWSVKICLELRSNSISF